MTSALTPLRGGSTTMTSGRVRRSASIFAACPASMQKNSAFSMPFCAALICILDRLRDDLDADGLFRVPRKTERDRARAAVKVEYRLSPGQSGQLHGLFIQALSLCVVDLIKRRGGQAELQPAERIGDGPIAIKRMEFRAEDGIALFGVGRKYDRRDARLGSKQGRDELLFLRQLRAVGDDADEELPAFRAEADIDVADIAGMCVFVIGADVICSIQASTAPRIASAQSGWMRQCATGMTVCVFPAKKPATGFPFCSCTGNCTLFR